MDSNKSIGRPPISVLQEQFDAAILQRNDLIDNLAKANGKITRLQSELKALVEKHDPHKVWGRECWVVLNSQKRENLEDFIGSPFGARNACAIGDHVQYMPDRQPVSSRPHKYDDSRPSKGPGYDGHADSLASFCTGVAVGNLID